MSQDLLLYLHTDEEIEAQVTWAVVMQLTNSKL
jgi:hypothetical protein